MVNDIRSQDYVKISKSIFFEFYEAYSNVNPFCQAPEEPIPKINRNNHVKKIIEYHCSYFEDNRENNFFPQDTIVYGIYIFHPNNILKSNEQEIYDYNENTLFHIYKESNDTTVYLLKNSLPLYAIKNKKDTIVFYEYENGLLKKVVYLNDNTVFSYKYKNEKDLLKIYVYCNDIIMNKFVYSLKDSVIVQRTFFFDGDTTHFVNTSFYYNENGNLAYVFTKNYRGNILNVENYIYDKNNLVYLYEFKNNECSVSSYYYNKHNDVNLIIKRSPCNNSISYEIVKYVYEYY